MEQILIDPQKKYQTIESFGVSGAWWAQEIGGWEEPDEESGLPKRERIAELLFDREKGIGVSCYRYNLGAGSKQSGKGQYSPACRRAESFDCDGGAYDWRCDKNAVWMLRQAVNYGVSEIIFFVNSPPERFTKNGMAHGSKAFHSNLSRANYTNFVNYCLDCVAHFRAEGIPVRYLSPVNEPVWKWTGGQEGCHYRPHQVRTLFRLFANALEQRPDLVDLKLSGAENGDIRWFNKTYCRIMLGDKKIRARVDAIDTHSYCVTPQVGPLPSLIGDRLPFLKRYRRYLDRHFPDVPAKTSEWTHMKGGRDYGMDSALEQTRILMEDLKKIYDGVEVPKETYTFYEYILDAKAKEESGVRAKDCAAVDELMKGYRMRQTILTRHDRQDCKKGVYGVIRRRLDRIVRKEILYYCKKNNVSENALFLSAFNYTAALFADEDGSFVNSIHSGRTDGRWTGLAGCLFKTYLCRYDRIPHEKVDELITRTGSQIMNTMKNYSPVSRMGDLFLQYQGDILSVPTPGDKPGERMHCIQLDSLPFHMHIMYDEEGFYTELRYWENRFDRKLLEVFLTCYEEIVRAMLEETSVRRLKRYIPDEMFPKHFYIDGARLNEEAGCNLVPGVRRGSRVKVYILDEGYRKKPFGAWGPLYVMDYQPARIGDVIENPYGPGTLYETGMKARILPDGTVDFLETSGREVMTDGVNGRRFFDLPAIEHKLTSIEGIHEAQVYMKYNTETNEMNLYADVRADDSFDTQACLESLKTDCPPEELLYGMTKI